MDCVLQPEVATPVASQKFDAQGNLTDETSKKLISQFSQALAHKARGTKAALN